MRSGTLVPVLLFPSELGGPERQENEVFITPAAAAARRSAIERITSGVQSGEFDHMAVDADYKGTSIVPARIRMTPRYKGTGRSLPITIDVW